MLVISFLMCPAVILLNVFLLISCKSAANYSNSGEAEVELFVKTCHILSECYNTLMEVQEMSVQ